jgi:REP element-mobilizing transposase RayT
MNELLEKYMSGTFHQIYIQVVFGTKGREYILPSNKKVNLHKYITGIVQNKNCKMICINSIPDHLHFLMGLHPAVCISDLVKDIKLATSELIKNEKWIPGIFYWQGGFGAFSYSRSEINRVCEYIEAQDEHHKRTTFREEYEALLKEFEVEFNPEYLLDWE